MNGVEFLQQLVLTCAPVVLGAVLERKTAPSEPAPEGSLQSYIQERKRSCPRR
jgi:hypothetical protein